MPQINKWTKHNKNNKTTEPLASVHTTYIKYCIHIIAYMTFNPALTFTLWVITQDGLGVFQVPTSCLAMSSRALSEIMHTSVSFIGLWHAVPRKQEQVHVWGTTLRSRWPLFTFLGWKKPSPWRPVSDSWPDITGPAFEICVCNMSYSCF